MPDSETPLAVTGATGAIGGAVARLLAAGGVPQRLLARNPAKAPQLPGSTVFACDYADGAAAARALAGIETLLMVSASESADRLDQHRAFVDAARAAKVKHIVYTSFFAAAPNATFTLARDHFRTEEHIKASGIAYTFLRDNFYIDFMSALVGEDGVIRGPAGEGRAAIVARSDIAKTAGTVLRNVGPHAGRTYNLTGPEALNMHEIARILAHALNKPIRFHDETLAEAYESRKKWEAPAWQNDAWVSTYTAIAAGEMSTLVGRVAERSVITSFRFWLPFFRFEQVVIQSSVLSGRRLERGLHDPARCTSTCLCVAPSDRSCG